MSRYHRGDRELVDGQAGAVVDQRLTLEDRGDAIGCAQAPEHGSRRDRIGGSEDRAQHQCWSPPDTRDRVSDRRHGGHRQQHEADREQPDRAGVSSKILGRGAERRGVDQRRQEHEQHGVGVDLWRGGSRHQPDRQTAEHEHDRVMNVDRPRHPRQHGRRQQQRNDQLDPLHTNYPYPSRRAGAAKTTQLLKIHRLDLATAVRTEPPARRRSARSGGGRSAGIAMFSSIMRRCA